MDRTNIDDKENAVKIAVSSSGPKLEDEVEARFGRCPYFLIVDPPTMVFEALPNPNVSLGGGAGPQSARMMSEKGVSVVLTGNCGPNALQTFGAAGIQVITGVRGKVRDAVERFQSGQLNGSEIQNVQPGGDMAGGRAAGMGGGRGMGGRGMGGCGKGGGRGMGGCGKGGGRGGGRF